MSPAEKISPLAGQGDDPERGAAEGDDPGRHDIFPRHIALGVEQGRPPERRQHQDQLGEAEGDLDQVVAGAR